MEMLSMSPQTPNGATGNPPISYVASPTSARSQGFKRPASSDDEDNGDAANARPGSRRSTVVKRACNECRQQKVRACGRESHMKSPKKTNKCQRKPLTVGSSDATSSKTLS